MKMKRTVRWAALGCMTVFGIPSLILVIGAGVFMVHGCSPPRDVPLLQDGDGRIVLYHGVNVSNYSKYAPDFLPWHSPDDFALIRDWGFNLVRYLVFWEAIEPAPGAYNDAYIEATLERIGWLEALGIDVLVDLHQDLYARPFGGNGFPEWTIDDGGHAFTPREPWNLNYMEPAVRASYRNFWTSDDLRGRYIAMVAYLLGHIEGQANVVGLDIMNEPWPAPLLGFERRILTPFYTEIQEMKRLEGFTTPLYFEPVIYTSTGWPSRLRFKPDPDAVYAPHYYDVLCHEGFRYTVFGRCLMRRGVHIKMKEARRFGVPLLYGEIGISTDVPGYGEFLDDFLGLLRRYHIGWVCYGMDKTTHSAFGLLDENGEPRYDLLRHYVFVYPQRVAGRNIETQYENERFTLAYDPIETDAPTVIAIPEMYSHARIWVNGAEVEYDPMQRRFKYNGGPGNSRQTIEVRWQSSPGAPE